MNVMVQYLNDIASLEGQLYTQNWIISSLNDKISKLGIPNHYDKPSRSAWGIKNFFYVDNESLLVILGFIITSITSVIDMIKYIFSWSLEADLEALGVDSILLGFLAVFWFYLGRPLIKNGLKYLIPCIFTSNIIDFIKYNTSEKKYFDEKLRDYNEAVHKDSLRVKKELSLKQVFQTQLQEVQQKRKITESALKALYDVGIIHPKYRYMVAVSSFYDYFDTGRCLSFTGPGGAYATYEEGLRFQRLETKLDIIISKLDEIIASQRMLASLMREANDTMYRIEQSNNKMMRGISQIEKNSEITAYNTRCTMESNMVMEHIAIYNAIKNS